MKGVAHAATTPIAADLRRTACSIGVLALGRAALHLAARCTKWRALPSIGVCLAPHCGRVPRGVAPHASIGIKSVRRIAPRTCNPLADLAYFNAGKLPHSSIKCTSIAIKDCNKDLATAVAALTILYSPLVGARAGVVHGLAVQDHMVCNGYRMQKGCGTRVSSPGLASNGLAQTP